MRSSRCPLVGGCESMRLVWLTVLSALVLLQSVAEIAHGSPLLFASQQRDQLLLNGFELEQQQHLEGSNSNSGSKDAGGDGVAYCSQSDPPEGKQLQTLSCKVTPYTLGAIDFLLFGFTLVLVIRVAIQSRNLVHSLNSAGVSIESKQHIRTRRRFFAKKFFLGVIVAVMAVRGAFLVSYPTIVVTPSFPISWFLVWNHGAELLFAFAYVMLLLFWLDFFLQVSQGKNTDFFFRYRTPVILFFVISTTIFIVLSILLFTWCKVDPMLRLHRYVLIDNIAAGYLSALFLLTALGFLAIGVQFILHVFRPQYSVLVTQQMKSKAIGIGVAAGVCTLGFIVRTALVIYSMKFSGAADFNVPWWVIAMFFFGTEVLPTLCMSLLLGRLTSPKSQSLQGLQVGESLIDTTRSYQRY